MGTQLILVSVVEILFQDSFSPRKLAQIDRSVDGGVYQRLVELIDKPRASGVDNDVLEVLVVAEVKGVAKDPHPDPDVKQRNQIQYPSHRVQ